MDVTIVYSSNSFCVCTGVKILYPLVATSLEALLSLGMVSTSCFVFTLFTDLF